MPQSRPNLLQLLTEHPRFDVHTHRLDAPAGHAVVSMPRLWLERPETVVLRPGVLYSAGLHPWWTAAERTDEEQTDEEKHGATGEEGAATGNVRPPADTGGGVAGNNNGAPHTCSGISGADPVAAGRYLSAVDTDGQTTVPFSPTVRKMLHATARWAAHPQVVAVGECGLDRLRGADMAVQADVFMAHVRLAAAARLPLIVHCVRAYDVLLRLHRLAADRGLSVPLWIIHGFRGRPALAAQMLHAGFGLSFGRYYNAAARDLTPPGRRFTETDDDRD